MANAAGPRVVLIYLILSDVKAVRVSDGWENIFSIARSTRSIYSIFLWGIEWKRDFFLRNQGIESVLPGICSENSRISEKLNSFVQFYNKRQKFSEI